MEQVERWKQRYAKEVQSLLREIENTDDLDTIRKRLEGTALLERKELSSIPSVQKIRKLLKQDKNPSLSKALLISLLSLIFLTLTLPVQAQEHITPTSTSTPIPVEMIVNADIGESQITEVQQEEDVYLVPQIVLSSLKKVLSGTAGSPKGFYTSEGDWLNGKYFEFQVLLLENGVNIETARHAMDIIAQPHTILISAESSNTRSIILHEKVHRELHKLPETQKERLIQARQELLNLMDNTTITKTTLVGDHETSLTNEIFQNKVGHILFGSDSEFWVYYIQEQIYPESTSIDSDLWKTTIQKADSPTVREAMTIIKVLTDTVR